MLLDREFISPLYNQYGYSREDMLAEMTGFKSKEKEVSKDQDGIVTANLQRTNMGI